MPQKNTLGTQCEERRSVGSGTSDVLRNFGLLPVGVEGWPGPLLMLNRVIFGIAQACDVIAKRVIRYRCQSDHKSAPKQAQMDGGEEGRI